MIKLTKRTPWQIQCDVVFALFLRELKTRFGAYRLGLVWAVLEPAAFVALLSFIRAINGSTETAGLPTPIFFALGYIPFQLFSKLVTQSANAVNANRGLFSYRQVKPFDALIARALLEVLISLAVLAMFFIVLAWMGFDVRIDNPLRFISIYLLITFMGLGLGIIVCVGVVHMKELDKIVPMLLRPLFFISGLFFSVSMIPQQHHDLLLWNPLLHAIELMREACYDKFHSSDVSTGFVFMVALSAMTIGMMLYKLNWQKVVAS